MTPFKVLPIASTVGTFAYTVLSCLTVYLYEERILLGFISLNDAIIQPSSRNQTDFFSLGLDVSTIYVLPISGKVNNFFFQSKTAHVESLIFSTS